MCRNFWRQSLAFASIKHFTPWHANKSFISVFDTNNRSTPVHYKFDIFYTREVRKFFNNGPSEAYLVHNKRVKILIGSNNGRLLMCAPVRSNNNFVIWPNE